MNAPTDQPQQTNPIPIGMLMPTDGLAGSTLLDERIAEELIKINASLHCAERMEAQYRRQKARS